jgi:hypothetical protein
MMKKVTIYWTEHVFMKNQIEVPEDWTAEDILNDPDGIAFNGAKDSRNIWGRTRFLAALSPCRIRTYGSTAGACQNGSL